jgi:hypothetical protein
LDVGVGRFAAVDDAKWAATSPGIVAYTGADINVDGGSDF